MSFFGSSGGFTQAKDPFASLTDLDLESEAIEYDDNYDGLADNLEEDGDDFNADTFGDDTQPNPVGKDFDFFGQTAKVADAIEEEHLRYNRQAPSYRNQQQQQQQQQHHPPTPQHHAAIHANGPPPQSAFFQQAPPQQYAPLAQQQLPRAHPAIRTGYEKYKNPEPEPDLNVDLSLWGIPSKTTKPEPTAPEEPQASGTKALSLEEVEAKMRAQAKSKQAAATAPPTNADFLFAKVKGTDVQPQQPPHLPQQPLSSQQQFVAPEALASFNGAQPPPPQHAIQPNQMLQQQYVAFNTAGIPLSTEAVRGVPLTEQEAFARNRELEARRSRRNHKVWLYSRDNGLMTHQDKHFITRIQLQQLLTATGAVDETNPEEAFNNDFYYQVLTSIRGGQRQNPSQPLHSFAQTYLQQTGGRQHGRRHGRFADNYVQRMEHQVARAVEAAKSKPKSSQLVMTGSLGKISFSNVKTPKPLLNIKRPDASDHKRSTNAVVDRTSTLKAIEKFYEALMKMEDNTMKMPVPNDRIPQEEFQAAHAAWLDVAKGYNEELWAALKVHEPIGATTVHPFISFLSFNKGKKAISRVFRHTTFEQRTTILTMIIFHLDQLDVVQGAVIDSEELLLNAALREKIELFSTVVLPSLFQFFNEIDLTIVDGILELIATKLNVDLIARTRIGTSLLTLVLSRAELIKQAGGDGVDTVQWSKWENTFDRFFDVLEPSLPTIFPANINSGDDICVWQLLAAIGVSASPEQQQRLVLAVKDRVLGTISYAKTLPAAMASQRLSNVNLFMQSIGLDVELLG